MKPKYSLPALLASQATTPERAWWLGVLLGDGNVYWSKSNARVSVCGSYSTVSRWLALLEVDKKPQEFLRSPGTFQGYLDSIVLVRHLSLVYGLCGPKARTLPWIEVPDEVFIHLARGLWDSDGSLCIDRRRHLGNKGNDSPMASFGVAAKEFAERFQKELQMRLALPTVALQHSSGTWKFKYAGKPAMVLADWLYRDAPEHLRNEDRVESYRELDLLRDQLDDDSCPSCGRVAQKQGYCTKCWWALRPHKVGAGTVCRCGKSPVHGRGLCSACYSRAQRRGKFGQAEQMGASPA